MRVETHLGDRLRALRKSRGLSLNEVAGATGISRSFLSLVETGRSDITLGRLMRLVKFYGTSIEELVPEPQPSEPMVVRAGEARHILSPAEGIDVMLLVADTERTMMPLVAEFEPHGHHVEYASHEGEEFIHILEGELEVTLDADVILLEAGDSLYFASDVPHALRNPSDEPARVLAVLTPPTLGRGPSPKVSVGPDRED